MKRKVRGRRARVSCGRCRRNIPACRATFFRLGRSKRRARPHLVTKLHLVTHLPAKFHFATVAGEWPVNLRPARRHPSAGSATSVTRSSPEKRDTAPRDQVAL